MKPTLHNPTYVYIIENVELGLYYIGKHAGTWSDDNGNDGYMGSSAYLNAIRAEFSEYPFTKSLIEQFNNDADATKFETEFILLGRETSPDCLLNRAPNDGTNQWLHEGYGALRTKEMKARLDKARKVVRPGVIKDGDFKCLILMKTAGGKAHPPMMPSNDRTPFQTSPYWRHCIQTWNELPEGKGHHFFCKVKVGTSQKTGKRTENYEPLTLVESFDTEQAARTAGSYYSKLGSIEYQEAAQQVLDLLEVTAENS